MKRIYKTIVLVLSLFLGIELCGCNYHRQTMVYGEHDNDYEIKENPSIPTLNYSEEELIDKLIDSGYVESIDKEMEVSNFTSPNGFCIVEMNRTEAKATMIPVTVTASDYNEVINNNAIYDELLSLSKIIGDLQNESIEPEKLRSFIEKSGELNGETIYLSEHISAYSQIFRGDVFIGFIAY